MKKTFPCPFREPRAEVEKLMLSLVKLKTELNTSKQGVANNQLPSDLVLMGG